MPEVMLYVSDEDMARLEALRERNHGSPGCVECAAYTIPMPTVIEYADPTGYFHLHAVGLLKVVHIIVPAQEGVRKA